MHSLFFSRPFARSLAATVLTLCSGGATHAAESHLLIGPETAPVFLNSVVGTDVLWNGGYYGTGIIIGNVEAGHVWGGHEIFDRANLSLPDNPLRLVNSPDEPGTELGEVDFHATMVGHVLVGAATIEDPSDHSLRLTAAGAGMAPLATLWSGAIATEFDKTVENAGSFNTTDASFRYPYVEFFTGGTQGRADVINSSWGYTDGPAREVETRFITGIASANPSVTAVFSAGNAGFGTDTVGGPGSSFNVITVGSLGGPSQLTPSSFSSGGWSSFYDPATQTTHPNARAAVHLAAPGENFALAAYLLPTGGLEPLLIAENINNPATNLYFTFSQSGTSFASPMVAGGVALLKQVVRDPQYGLPQTQALDARVMRSVVMATAQRTEGWNNGQAVVSGGASVTTQALDLQTGAGRFDVGRAALLYAFGTPDVAGTSGGVDLSPEGWDFGALTINNHNDYVLDVTATTGPQELTVSLNWFVNDHVVTSTGAVSYGSFANLDLEVWQVSISGSFLQLVAASRTLYNNTEFLRLPFMPDNKLGLRVRFDGMVYDIDDDSGGLVGYGLAWATSAIPEPASLSHWAGFCALAWVTLGRRRVRAGHAGRPRFSQG